MKHFFSKSRKVSKGAPSGFMISLIFHGVIFFLAGLFVVFKVLPKPEPVFKAPPPIERPKMKLKKPRVKIQKSSTPKPSSRIVAKVKTAKMPDIQIPDLMGTGEGLLGGVGAGGEFLDMPTIPEVSQLGSTTSVGNDLEATFFDFKRNSSGHWIADSYTTPEYLLIVNQFIRSGWRDSSLARYYRSPKKLYATCIVIPPNVSSVGPVAFDPKPDEAAGGAWMVHYKGKLVCHRDITFRFVCSSDYFIVIRVDGKIVWAGVWNPVERYADFQTLVGPLYKIHMDTRRFIMGNDLESAGDWITLKADVPKDIDIIIGDENGECGWTIAVDEKGKTYPKGPQENPIYPAFKTARLSHDMIDQIYKDLSPGLVCLTNGPIFNDYDTDSSTGTPSRVQTKQATAQVVEKKLLRVDDVASRGMRTWTFKNGQTLKARYIKDLFNKLQLKDADGKEYTLPIEKFDLSSGDKEYLALDSPPTLKLEWRKSIQRKNFSLVRGAADRPPEQRANFGAEVKQVSTGDYKYPLTVDIYAIGQEIKGDRYILLDHQSRQFSLTKANKYTYEFSSPRDVHMTDMWPDSTHYSERGEQYDSFIIVVKDKRGKVVAMHGSHPWLEEHLSNLEKLKIGNYMDKTCQRVYPSRPKTYFGALQSDFNL